MPLGLGLHANFALHLIVAAFSLPALTALLPCAADPIKIGLRVATLAAMATFCSPTGDAELQSYTVTVLEQIYHQITVEAAAEYAARTDALLEARRTSGSGKPWWEPSPPSVLAHAREAGGSAVIKVEPLFQRDAQKVEALDFRGSR